MSTKNTSRFMPLIIAISVVAGILIGTFYARHFAGNKLGIINSSSNKLNALLRVIDDQYVDTVNMTDLVEKAMPQILAELDPHSTYIPAQKLEEVNSELEGSFSGIGIQFTIQEDTIHVNSVIPGGPSEKVGLMAGDRIVMVNDSLFAGKGLTNEKAMRNLKGPKGSQVKLGVKRATEKELLDFTITRGDIPQNTIDAAYMLDDDYGYIQISKFGHHTRGAAECDCPTEPREVQRPDYRPARQYRRIHGSRHTHGERIPAGREVDCIYPRPQISPHGGICQRYRQLPEAAASGIGKREFRFGQRNLCGRHSGQ